MIPSEVTMSRNGTVGNIGTQPFMGEHKLLTRQFPLFDNQTDKNDHLWRLRHHKSLVQALVAELDCPARSQSSVKQCVLKLRPEDRSALERAYGGFPAMLNFIANRVPLEELNEAYKAKIIEIQRVGIDEPFLDRHRDELKKFIDLLKDSRKAVDDHRRGFDSLHKDIKEYLFYVIYITWKGDLQGVGNNFGEERLLGDPSLLLGLLTPTGESFLEELEEILSIQDDLHEAMDKLSNLIDEYNSSFPDPQACGYLTGELRAKCLGMGEKTPRFNHLANQFSISLDCSVENRLKYLEKLRNLLRKVAHDFSFEACRHRAKQSRYLQQVGPKTFHYTDTSMEKVRVHVPHNRAETPRTLLNLIIVSYELSKNLGPKFGGLGEAIYSRIKTLQERGHKVTVLCPDFHFLGDQDEDGRPNDWLESDSSKREVISVDGVRELVGVNYREVDGINLVRFEGGLKKYFDIRGNIGGLYQDGKHAEPGKPWFGLKKRMAYFGAVAAAYLENRLERELAGEFPKTDVIEFNDWHAALAVDLLYREIQRKVETQEIEEGDYHRGDKLPAIVFVCHNNGFGAQGVFSEDEAEIIASFGGVSRGFNVAQSAMERSDMSLTVSPTFALEMQSEQLGAGMEQWARRLAHSGRFKGIINGSNPEGWNPNTALRLTNWIDPVTNELCSLAYSTATGNIAAHREIMKAQLGKWIEVHGDPKAQEFLAACGGSLVGKDVISFVGRYDSSQKGLEQFKYIMQQAHKMGAVFICMGVSEDETANKILDDLERIAARDDIPAWIQRGYSSTERRVKDPASIPEDYDTFPQQNVGSLGIQLGGDRNDNKPGVGEVIRGLSTVTVVPSKFEPCGLVQFEAWLFGVAVVSVNSGGLKDTVKEGVNGFVFDRKGLWDSEEQGVEAASAIERALTAWRGYSSEKKQVFSRSVMTAAQNSSWTEIPEGSPPIEEYENLYLMAAQRAKHRDKFAITSMPTLDYTSQELFDLPYFQTEELVYDVYGVHFDKEKPGTAIFRVAAPRAISVSLVIDGKEELIPMQWHNDGSWSTTADGIAEGMIYSYQIEIEKGIFATKSDPFAFSSAKVGKEMRSVVANPDEYIWKDLGWMNARKAQGDRFYKEGPTNIIELRLGEYALKPNGQPYNYKEYAHKLAEHCKEFHYNEVELFGVFEHPLDESMGYLVSGFFSPTSRYGTVQDFQYMIDYLHGKDIRVVVDFIPGHFSIDQSGLVDFDGQPFFEHPDPMKGLHHLWGSKVFNYESKNIREFLIGSAKYFADKLHIDGFRVDAVQSMKELNYCNKPNYQWDPNESGSSENLAGYQFIRELNYSMKQYDPSIEMVAEDTSGAQNVTEPVVLNENGELTGGLGFEGGIWASHAVESPIEFFKEKDRTKLGMLTGPIGQFEHVVAVLPRCHDSYNTQHGKASEFEMFAYGVDDIVLFHGFMMTHPVPKKLNFMGNDICAKEGYLPKVQRGVVDMRDAEQECVARVTAAWNKFYTETPAFYQHSSTSYQWIYENQEAGVLEYRRKDDKGNTYRVVHNFSTTNFPVYDLTIVDRLGSATIVMNSEKLKQDRNLNERVTLCDNGALRLRIGPLSSYVIKETIAA